VRAHLRLDGHDYESDSPLDDVDQLRNEIHGAMVYGAVTWHRLADDGGVLIVNWRAIGRAHVTAAADTR
jgi:hypothetical protein